VIIRNAFKSPEFGKYLQIIQKLLIQLKQTFLKLQPYHGKYIWRWLNCLRKGWTALCSAYDAGMFGGASRKQGTAAVHRRDGQWRGSASVTLNLWGKILPAVLTGIHITLALGTMTRGRKNADAKSGSAPDKGSSPNSTPSAGLGSEGSKNRPRRWERGGPSADQKTVGTGQRQQQRLYRSVHRMYIRQHASGALMVESLVAGPAAE
jgi:hypothetical protein